MHRGHGPAVLFSDQRVALGQYVERIVFLQRQICTFSLVRKFSKPRLESLAHFLAAALHQEAAVFQLSCKLRGKPGRKLCQARAQLRIVRHRRFGCGSRRFRPEIGDEVTTIGGIVGRVVAIKEDTIVLETGNDRVKIRFRRSAIGSVEKLSMEDVKEKDKKEK